MSIPIIINNQTIDFPSDGESPDWSGPVIQFAEAVAAALAISTNPFDVSPQAFILDAYNSASNVSIPALSFPISSVRAVFIRYSVYRTTNSTNADEAGDIIACYNPNNSVGLKWYISRGNITGKGGQIAFNMTDSGQVQFSTTALAGSAHAGKIEFDARAFAQ